LERHHRTALAPEPLACGKEEAVGRVECEKRWIHLRRHAALRESTGVRIVAQQMDPRRVSRASVRAYVHQVRWCNHATSVSSFPNAANTAEWSSTGKPPSHA